MARMHPPIVPEQPVPVLTMDQLRALLAGCKSNAVLDRRDAAIIRLLVDTGGRLGEVAGLTLQDVDFENDVIHVMGKGRRGRALPFGQQTGVALGRYLRVRARDQWQARPEVWPSEKNRGPLAADGIKQMLRRRGDAVGIDGLHAHMFRHTAAHRWLADGRIGNRPDADHGLEVPADAPPVRRVPGRRAGPGCSPPVGVGRPTLTCEAAGRGPALGCPLTRGPR